ncbi:hypothetical protein, partial [Salmonella sp. SAL4433]|uniref:hypothetical protein n=1 Tax=Salmonella sp. SAL4433 TaxID=3159888 RepID=UPI00397B1E25
WAYWDIVPAQLDAAWTQLWFDYPDAATTDRHLHVSFNMFDASDRWQRAIVMRFSLDELASGGTPTVRHWSTDDNGSLRFSQGATDAMYWS